MIKDIKNAGDNNFSRRDGFQTLKEAFNDSQSAYDQNVVNSLVPARYTEVSWDFQTLGDGSDDIKYIYFWGHGETEANQIEIGTSPLGSTEKTTINFAGLTPEGLSGTYFFIYDDIGSVAIWFNLDGGDAEPVIVANRFIEIPINTGDSSSDIAAITAGTIHADSQFTAVDSTTYVMIASITNGNKLDSTDGNSGLSITTTDGTDTINNKYIYIYDADNNKFHVWWNVNSTGVDPDPDPGNSAPIEVALDVAETATTVATKSSLAIDALDEFISTSEDGFLIVKNVEEGTSSGLIDGNTGYVIDEITAGEDKPLVVKLQVFYDIDYIPSKIVRINHA